MLQRIWTACRDSDGHNLCRCRVGTVRGFPDLRRLTQRYRSLAAVTRSDLDLLNERLCDTFHFCLGCVEWLGNKIEGAELQCFESCCRAVYAMGAHYHDRQTITARNLA